MDQMSRLTWYCLTGVILLTACSKKQPEAISTTAPAQAPATVVAASVAPPVGEFASQVANQTINPVGSADRLPPPDVPPVERDGVRYAQAEDGRTVGHKQKSGVLVASAVASGKQLWSLVVYTSEVDPRQEVDAQWVFFKSMAFEPDGRLRIVNEADKAFLVDVQHHTVSPTR